MKQYPTIRKEIIPNIDIVAFDKLDGSNIRAEWTRKSGFNKFGRRRGLLDDTNPILKNSESLFISKYEKDLIDIFNKERLEKAVCFFEFWGENSAYGQHDENEEQKVTLIDVHVHKKGMLPPREFIKLFGHLDIPRIVHKGRADGDFVDSVKSGKVEGMSFEGVVCKSNTLDKRKMPIMFKIKTDAWMEKLRKHCNGDDKMFEALA